MGFFDRVRSLFGGVSEAPNAGGGGGSASRDPGETVVKKLGLALGGFGRDFIAPEFDLTEITNAYNTEAYVRQAIDKYIELMFKAGWDLVGRNPKSVEYVKKRLAMMAEVTQTPLDQFFIELAEDLVKYSNVIIVKARAKDLNSLPPGIPVRGIGDMEPIAGYFALNVTTMSVKRDKNGVVKGWQQEVDGGNRPIKFKAEDIIHIYYKKEKGAAFGTPFILPVLDDIRALRQAEENVLRLIYRNLFPYVHVQVGLAQEGFGGTNTEIQQTQLQIQSMDLEAGLVTSERVNIKPIANDKIIDANPYLKYFEQRVFTGLGVSELMMGRGNTANRSTGDNLSGEFTDRVKAFQRVLSIFVDQFIIKELLLEGGFDIILNPEDDVDFVFKEIDVDAKIKAENHAVYLYEHNSISEDEMRNLIGRDAIQDNDTRNKMYLNLITIPQAKSKSDSSNNQADTDNRNRPRNQYNNLFLNRVWELCFSLSDELRESNFADKDIKINDAVCSIKDLTAELIPEISFNKISYSLNHSLSYLATSIQELINNNEEDSIDSLVDMIYSRIEEIILQNIAIEEVSEIE